MLFLLLTVFPRDVTATLSMEDKECFICLSGEEPPPLQQSPCLCRGSVGFCHARCLEAALLAQPRATCPACRAPYPPMPHPLPRPDRTKERLVLIFIFTCLWVCLCSSCVFFAAAALSDDFTFATTAACVSFLAMIINAVVTYKYALRRHQGTVVQPENL